MGISEFTGLSDLELRGCWFLAFLLMGLLWTVKAGFCLRYKCKNTGVLLWVCVLLCRCLSFHDSWWSGWSQGPPKERFVWAYSHWPAESLYRLHWAYWLVLRYLCNLNMQHACRHLNLVILVSKWNLWASAKSELNFLS